MKLFLNAFVSRRARLRNLTAIAQLRSENAAFLAECHLRGRMTRIHIRPPHPAVPMEQVGNCTMRIA